MVKRIEYNKGFCVMQDTNKVNQYAVYAWNEQGKFWQQVSKDYFRLGNAFKELHRILDDTEPVVVTTYE